MRRKLTKIECTVIGCIGIVLIMLLADGPTYHKHSHECVLCRLVRNDWRGPFGREWSEYEENECSTWYAQKMEETHEHVWQGSSSNQTTNVWGTPNGVSDSDKPFGILKVAPADQIELYRHIGDPTEASKLFLAMRNNAETRDEERWQIVRQQTEILKRWIDSKFTQPWAEVRAELDAR